MGARCTRLTNHTPFSFWSQPVFIFPGIPAGVLLIYRHPDLWVEVLSIDRHFAQPVIYQEVAEVLMGFKVIRFSCFNEALYECASLCSSWQFKIQPILTPHYKRTNRILSQIVIHTFFIFIRIPYQAVPLPKYRPMLYPIP